MAGIDAFSPVEAFVVVASLVVDGSPLEARPGDIVLALAQPTVGVRRSHTEK